MKNKNSLLIIEIDQKFYIKTDKSFVYDSNHNKLFFYRHIDAETWIYYKKEIDKISPITGIY